MSDTRPLDEQFDTVMEVKRNPTGAFMAIEAQAARIRELEAENAALREARGVRVKPLVWRFHRDPKDTSEARTQIGSWTVWEINGAAYCHGPNDTCGKPCEGGINGAKAAAQADYERRILAAIEPALVTVGGDLEPIDHPLRHIEACLTFRVSTEIDKRGYSTQTPTPETVQYIVDELFQARDRLRALADAGK